MSSSTIFGQVVFGPPGSGKTTYCHVMSQFLQEIGRKVAVINMDPANDTPPYDAAVELGSLITLDDTMSAFHLGPNGGLVYCMEYLEKNVDWLLERINKLDDHYIIIDCPGQIELYTHHSSVKNIICGLEKFGVRLCAVHLVDSHYCSDPGKFIAVLLTSLSTMLQIELPHVNVLSKIDLAEKYGKLQFGLDFYSEVLDLNYLLDLISEDPFMKKYMKMNKALIEVVENYSLVSFLVMNVNDPKTVMQVRSAVDKANGYVFGSGEQRNIQALLSTAVGAQFDGERFTSLTEHCMEDEDPVESVLRQL